MNKREPNIYLVCGKARSGKDEVAKIMSNHLENSVILSITSPLKEYAKIITGWDGTEETKPRELLQELGIDLIKNNIDNELLVRRTKEDIEILSYYKDNIIITGIRLKEEIDKLKEQFSNVKVIKVIRPNFDNKLTDKQKHHITENDLNEYTGDFNIINNNYSSLENQILNILGGRNE